MLLVGVLSALLPLSGRQARLEEVVRSEARWPASGQNRRTALPLSTAPKMSECHSEAPVFPPPDDHSRVPLTQLDGNPCSDYINASYIDVSFHVLVSPLTKTNLICGPKSQIAARLRVWLATSQLCQISAVWCCPG